MSVWFSIIMIRLVESLRKVYVFSFMPVLLFFLTLLDLEKQKKVSVVGLLSVSFVSVQYCTLNHGTQKFKCQEFTIET